jgi:site-specific recombinase XerD
MNQTQTKKIIEKSIHYIIFMLFVHFIKNIKIMVKKFRKFLEKNDFAKNTVVSYTSAVRSFKTLHKTFNHSSLVKYKCWLTENYKPKTVNLRLQAINKYLAFINKSQLRQKLIKIEHKQYVENVISSTDYSLFKNVLKNNGHTKWYFIIWLLATTGARISELLQLKIEHIQASYMDVYSKGGKTRRLYIPTKLRSEVIQWLITQNVWSDYVFKNSKGKQMSSRSVSLQLKRLAVKYDLNRKVVYPHSFRHRFAKNFLNKCSDIALLADLMGHTSIETTRIYLRHTTCEQQVFIDRIVTW